MFFEKLSGYPFIDINISFIFNLIPLEIILEVFIFSFLEYNIIFYSSKPEFLNSIIYLLKCFNYPFNNSIYYQCILSISKDLFISEISTFIDNTYSTMIGVLSEYDPEIYSNKIIKDHFVFDIDNKNFFFFYQEENDKVRETMYLYTYIKNCIKDISYNSISNSVKDIFKERFRLYECIKNLMEKLKKRSDKVTAKNYNESLYKPSFFNLYEFETEMKSIESNKYIQEAF